MEIEDDSSTSPSTSHGQHNGYNGNNNKPLACCTCMKFNILLFSIHVYVL